MEEVEFLCAKGYLSKDSSGYYRISDTASLNSILSISKSGILGWRSKYIEVVFDSLLTKSFPRVVRAVQNEPGISLLESINRTSTLLESSLINALYEDFGVLKEIIGDPQIDLVVPASLWIDTVKREQIVDATHPVDIKVTWPAINNVALIEVKWLGDSGQTQYRDARANEGAKQLIDYLASSVQEEPDKHFVGYLTVFDGRRGKTSNQYERQEINYRSEYSSHPSMNYRRFYMAECV